MDGWRKGLAGVVLLLLGTVGGVACGGPSTAPKATTPDVEALTNRVLRLEAWQMIQQKIARDQQSALMSQVELNRSFRATLAASVEHAKSVDRALEGQQKTLALLSEVIQDLLAKLKTK